MICLQCRRPGFDLWVRKISWRREWQPIPVFLPRGSHGQSSLVGYSPWELDMTERQTHIHNIWKHAIKVYFNESRASLQLSPPLLSVNFSWGAWEQGPCEERGQGHIAAVLLSPRGLAPGLRSDTKTLSPSCKAGRISVNLQNRNRLTDTETNLRLPKGEGGAGIYEESGTSRDKL